MLLTLILKRSQLGRDYMAEDWTEAENRAIVDDYLPIGIAVNTRSIACSI